MTKVNMNVPDLPFAMSEAFNSLRINVKHVSNDVKKIMIISTVPNEGKSFVAINLWKQFAQLGVPCVYLDADMRNSNVISKYDIESESEFVGFSDYLSSDKTLEDTILQGPYASGDLIVNKENLVNPTLLVESKKFKQTLNELASKYRYVFIDCPPLDLVSDGELIASMCDGVIFVVRANSTPKKAIMNSIHILERANCPIIGSVLNRVETSKSGYYSKSGYGYYGREYGYGYTKEDKE